MPFILDPVGRAKKAQVGVDLTLGKVSKVGKYNAFDLMSYQKPLDSWWSSAGIILNDEKATGTLRHAKVAEYTVIEPMAAADGLSTFTAWHLEPGAYAIEFNEGLKPLPVNNTAIIINRSSVARSGALIRSSVYDPGFASPAMGAMMYVFTPIIIEEHARVAQILIFENEEAEAYNGQYMDLPGLQNSK